MSGKKKLITGLFGLLLVIGWVIWSGPKPMANPAQPAGREYIHLALLSDPHLPGKNREKKEQVILGFNTWPDLDGVVVLGDITHDRGTVKEYSYVKQLFVKLKPPLYPIGGNHDYIYEDELDVTGKKVKSSPETRREKLSRFKETFSLDEVYYSRKLGSYLLVFLTPDEMQANYLTAISETQLKWLEQTLAQNKRLPAIIFFHGPLKGTLAGNNSVAANANFWAQPVDAIDRIIKANPQVFLWISGHTHTAPTNRYFNDPVNVYQGQVTNIHNPDLNGSSFLNAEDIQTTKHDGLWTNSLYLYPDRAVIRLYDHKAGAWLGEERVVALPKL